MDSVAYKQQKSISHSSGGLKSMIKANSVSGEVSLPSCMHWGLGDVGVFSYKDINLIRSGLHPYNLI